MSPLPLGWLPNVASLSYGRLQLRQSPQTGGIASLLFCIAYDRMERVLVLLPFLFSRYCSGFSLTARGFDFTSHNPVIKQSHTRTRIPASAMRSGDVAMHQTSKDGSAQRKPRQGPPVPVPLPAVPKTPLKPRRQTRAIAAMVAIFFTAIALALVVLCLTVLDIRVDVLSPGFGVVGLGLGIWAIQSPSRAEDMARANLTLNVTYWIAWGLILLANH